MYVYYDDTKSIVRLFFSLAWKGFSINACRNAAVIQTWILTLSVSNQERYDLSHISNNNLINENDIKKGIKRITNKHGQKKRMQYNFYYK